MENIRIGNSVHVSWRLYNNNGSQYVLSGKIRRLWIISAALEKEISSYGIQGRNELVFSIPADDLIRYGTYKIRLSIRESESGTEDATYELTQVFQVVSKSYPNASGAIGGVVELPFTTVLNNVVVERIEGLSAYEIAVNNGYEGTEQEWVAEYNNALNAATTAAADASAAITAFNANEQARIEVENERVAAEAARVLAENGRASAEATRVSNESGRVAAEEARVSAEAGRVTAENGRVDAESSRVSAESSRVSAESSRVSAESARATRSASDHTRAENDHSLAVSDHSTASSDHTTAAGDHTTAVSDHTRAENDHTTAAADHTTAGGDHTTATGDHTQAVADHTQAASDHTASVSATEDAIAAAAAATEAAESIEQSDWSENDSDDPAYIKSRTHWVDVETTTINDAKLAWSGSTVEDLDFWFHGTDVHIPRTSIGWGLTWEGGELFIDDNGYGYELGVFNGEEWSYNPFDPSYDQQPYTLGVDVVIASEIVHKLDNKFLDMDSEPTTGSGKPVTSGGVKAALDAIPTVPTISTNIEADGASDAKTASPKAVKTFVEGKGYGTYSKPSGGIPASDLASGVIPTVPVISTDIEADKTSDTKTASAKAVYTQVSQLRSEVDGLVQNTVKADYAIADEDGYNLVEFKDGHIKTKHFDSSLLPIKAIEKAVFMGDSITQGVYSYWNGGVHTDANRYNGFDISSMTSVAESTAYHGIHYYFAKYAGCDIVNLGKRGTGWVADTRNLGNALAVANGFSFADIDFVALFFGVNDYIKGMPIGAIGTAGTVRGNMASVIQKIASDNPLCKIVVYSPYNTFGQVSKGGDYIASETLYGDDTTNYALGYDLNGEGTLEDYVSAIDDVCAFYGVQHVKLSESNVVNRLTLKDIMIDGLHPSKEAYPKLAAEIYGKGNYGA